jgi:hypothetical protein
MQANAISRLMICPLLIEPVPSDIKPDETGVRASWMQA